jgi:hypothetical protein
MACRLLPVIIRSVHQKSGSSPTYIKPGQAEPQGRHGDVCDPQFRGIWRDIGWRRRLTGLIKASALDADLKAAA